jgi:hypothetical protein
MTPSETWLEVHPGATVNDYVQAMQSDGRLASYMRTRPAVRHDSSLNETKGKK